MDFKREPQRGPACSSGCGRQSVLSQTVLAVGHRRCTMLFRRCVSRKAAGKGRALLEGVGLSPEAIEMCYTNWPHNEEETVQSGLLKWMAGEGASPTWAVLLEAMDYAEISVQHISALEEEVLKAEVTPQGEPSAPQEQTSRPAVQSEKSQQVLDEFRVQFIQDMDSNAVVLDLLHYNIITEGDQRTISTTMDRTQQNKFLHLYLRKCTEDAFCRVCNIILNVKGNPRMSALGTAMKRRLATAPLSSAPPSVPSSYSSHC